MSRARAATVCRALPALLLALSAQPGSADSPQLLRAERVASGLTLPLYVAAPPGDDRLFIVEQPGRIRIVEDGVLLPDPFLDLTAEVVCCGGRGLLGLAFAPDYAQSGTFYVHYIAPGGNGFIRVDRFQVSAGDPNQADPTSGEMLLEIGPHPSLSHHGGELVFGPDGMLYIPLGDGGTYPDDDFPQEDDTFYGKVLRIDVSGGPGSGYTVPPDNPYVGPGLPLDEIWAKGLRNPAKADFDALTGDLYLSDIGQVTREEVNVAPYPDLGEGDNYGWSLMEGSVCISGDPLCSSGTLTLPVYDYARTQAQCAITGGTVYRGALAAIQGEYFFSDYCSGELWSFVWDGAGGITSLTDWTAQVAPPGGFQQIVAVEADGKGELHLVDRLAGEVWKVVSRQQCDDQIDNDGDGQTDFPADPGCADAGDPSEAFDCDDTLDNDGDGLADAPADPGCVDAADASEREAGLVCDDGVDNDGDGLADFPADEGCHDPAGLSELADCDDGLDNDGDGLIDAGLGGDPGCRNTHPAVREDPECNDGVDNDGDMAVDYPDDARCMAYWDDNEATDPKLCGLGWELALVAPLLLLPLRRRRR
jgi:glucose/arabinose dehydrogenase